MQEKQAKDFPSLQMKSASSPSSQASKANQSTLNSRTSLILLLMFQIQSSKFRITLNQSLNLQKQCVTRNKSSCLQWKNKSPAANRHLKECTKSTTSR